MKVSAGKMARYVPALTARERAYLVLRAFKDRSGQDAQVWQTMPTDQRDEFFRLISHLKHANSEIGWLIVWMWQEVRLLEVRYCWLTTLQIQALEFSLIAGEVTLTAREPVTQREWAKLKRKGGTPDQYDVYADDVADAVAAVRTWRAGLSAALDGARGDACEPSAVGRPNVGGVGPPDPAALSRSLIDHIREGLVALWPELLALKTVAEDVAGEFHGEDVLEPLYRRALEDAAASVMGLHERLAEDGEPFDLPTECGEQLVNLRAILACLP